MTQLTPWPRGPQPRFAGVSSFGFGGTNAHVLLTEAAQPAQSKSAPAAVPTDYLLPLSARNEVALRESATAYLDFLITGQGANLPPADIAYTASCRRLHHEYRSGGRWQVAVRVGSRAAEVAARGVVRATPADEAIAANLVFAYSGQGSQWATVGAQLLATEPVFREALEQCDALLKQHAPWSIIAELRGSAGNIAAQSNQKSPSRDLLPSSCAHRALAIVGPCSRPRSSDTAWAKSRQLTLRARWNWRTQCESCFIAAA